MKFKLLVAFLVVFATVGLTGCGKKAPTGSDQNPHISVELDFSGQVPRLGTNVNVSWTCEGCEDIVGTSVEGANCWLNSSGNQAFCNDVQFIGPLSGAVDWKISGASGATHYLALWTIPRGKDLQNAHGASGHFRVEN